MPRGIPAEGWSTQAEEPGECLVRPPERGHLRGTRHQPGWRRGRSPPRPVRRYGPAVDRHPGLGRLLRPDLRWQESRGEELTNPHGTRTPPIRKSLPRIGGVHLFLHR